jgi:hypothetical protein
MRQAACRGDASTFFAHVDEVAVVTSIYADELGGTAAKLPTEPTGPQVAAKQRAEATLPAWRADITKQSSQSSFCRAKIEEVEPPAKTSGTLVANFPSASVMQLGFAQQGKTWKLVSYQGLPRR